MEVIMMVRIGFSGTVFAVLLATSIAASAQPTQAVRVRGTVVSLEGATLVVKSRDGKDVSVHLADNWAPAGIVKSTLADVKKGVFIGTAAVPEGDKLRALEVVVFPEAMRGTGEGHYAWDLGSTSTMTNANIDDTVEAVDGRTLTLSYKGGSKKIEVPKGVPIVTFAPADKADVKPGAHVMVPSQQQADGTLNASRVLVGKDGTVPPM
jgi:hypothetical protein